MLTTSSSDRPVFLFGSFVFVTRGGAFLVYFPVDLPVLTVDSQFLFSCVLNDISMNIYLLDYSINFKRIFIQIIIFIKKKFKNFIFPRRSVSFSSLGNTTFTSLSRVHKTSVVASVVDYKESGRSGRRVSKAIFLFLKFLLYYFLKK